MTLDGVETDSTMIACHVRAPVCALFHPSLCRYLASRGSYRNQVHHEGNSHEINSKTIPIRCRTRPRWSDPFTPIDSHRDFASTPKQTLPMESQPNAHSGRNPIPLFVTCHHYLSHLFQNRQSRLVSRTPSARSEIASFGTRKSISISQPRREKKN
jgi:hypothetical protein